MSCFDDFTIASTLQTEMVKDDNQKELRIYTDAGRILRPLLVVQNQRLVLSKRHINNMTLKLNSEKPQKYKECWDYLLENGVVELLGIEEE
jgi:DNA-directed RNA polymerase II subunit RPB2